MPPSFQENLVMVIQLDYPLRAANFASGLPESLDNGFRPIRESLDLSVKPGRTGCPRGCTCARTELYSGAFESKDRPSRQASHPDGTIPYPMSGH